MTARSRRWWITFAVVQFAMLWATKPLTTGGERWVPTPLAHVVTAVIVLLFGALLYWSDRRTARTRQPAQPAATSGEDQSAAVQPSGPDDPFCTCPSCGLLGTHAVRREVFHTPKYDDGHGDVVEVFCAAMPVDGSPVTKRTCVFCRHTWLRTAQEVA